MTLVGIVVIVLLSVTWTGYVTLGNARSLRGEKPLREEIRARPATFRGRVEMRNLRGPVSLSVHGDAFEVAQKVPVIGFLNGSYYCYRAQDVTIETAHGFRYDWIKIRGLPGTGSRPVQIGHSKMNRVLWDVLASAGAHPIGPPPER